MGKKRGIAALWLSMKASLIYIEKATQFSDWFVLMFFKTDGLDVGVGSLCFFRQRIGRC